jgi:hypothetical protein
VNREKAAAAAWGARGLKAKVDANAAKAKGEAISYDTWRLLSPEDRVGWKQNEFQYTDRSGPNGRDENDIYDYKFNPTDAEKIQIAERQAAADVSEAEREAQLKATGEAEKIRELQELEAAAAEEEQMEAQLKATGEAAGAPSRAAEAARAASALAAVAPYAMSALNSATPDVLANSIAAAAPAAASSAPLDGGVCDNQVYRDEREKLIAALSKRKVGDIADTWAKMLQACGDLTPPPKSLTAFREAKTRDEQAQAVINVILSLVANKTITQEKANELLAAKPVTAGKRRRRKTPKRRRARKARNSTFRRHRKH